MAPTIPETRGPMTAPADATAKPSRVSLSALKPLLPYALAGSGYLRRRGLDLVLALIAGLLAARRALLLNRGVRGRSGSGLLVSSAYAGSNRSVHVRQRLGRLGRRGIGHGGLLLLGQNRQTQARTQERGQRYCRKT